MKEVLCVILGGGRGSRLFPLTKERCKPAVPLFGKYSFNPAGVQSGDVLLVRLQVTDATTVNAQLDVDTTAEGTNGWRDQWCFSMTVGTVRR